MGIRRTSIQAGGSAVWDLIPTTPRVGCIVGVSCHVELSEDSGIARLSLGLAEGLFSPDQLDNLIVELSGIQSRMKDGR